MKKHYISPITTVTVCMTQEIVATSVQGPDTDFSGGLNEWEEGLPQGVRGEENKSLWNNEW